MSDLQALITLQDDYLQVVLLTPPVQELFPIELVTTLVAGRSHRVDGDDLDLWRPPEANDVTLLHRESGTEVVLSVEKVRGLLESAPGKESGSP